MTIRELLGGGEDMTPEALLACINEKSRLDFLNRMVQHKSYTQTEGERALAGFMVEQMRTLGLEAAPSSPRSLRDLDRGAGVAVPVKF
jgi:acetylornithine deacetylase